MALNVLLSNFFYLEQPGIVSPMILLVVSAIFPGVTLVMLKYVYQNGGNQIAILPV